MHNKQIQNSRQRRGSPKAAKFKMQNFIKEIVEYKKRDVRKRKKVVSLEEIKKTAYSSREGVPSGTPESRNLKRVLDFGTHRLVRPFARTIKNAAEKKGVAFITEIKLASPSEPSFGSKKDVQTRAKMYEEAGADAISIVTEKHFFKGDVSFVTKIKESVSIPVLQKDFVIDAYQIYEAKKLGADAILLIARLVEKEQLVDFVDLAFSLGIDPVVEVHSAEDLEKAVATPTGIIAVNARDLDTMEVNIDKTCELLKKVPQQCIKLGFSGIASKDDVEKYKKVEVDGVLVGTALMKTGNIQEFLGGLR